MNKSLNGGPLSKGLACGFLTLIALSAAPSTAQAQGYVVFGYRPVLYPVYYAPPPVFYAPPPVVYAPPPVAYAPAPIVQTSYYAPVPVVEGAIVKERINTGLFGQLNHHVKGVDPYGPFKDHSRVGWAGYHYRSRHW